MNEEDSKKTNEAAEAPAPEARDAAPEVKEAAPEVRDAAPAVKDAASENEANIGNTEPMPAIETTSECREFPGGCMRRTSLNWSEKLEVWHEVPEFSIDLPAYTKINQFFKDLNKSIFTRENLSQLWEYHVNRDPENTEKYESGHRCEITEHTDKLLSVTLCYEWYMGGVLDYGCSGYVFNLETGDRMTIDKYSGKSIEEIRKAVKSGLEEQYSEAIDDIDWENFGKMNTFEYYIKDAKIHVLFKKYEIASGAAGAFDVALAF